MRIISIARSIALLGGLWIVSVGVLASTIQESTNFSNSTSQIETKCSSGGNAASSCAISIKKNGYVKTILHFPDPPSNIGLNDGVFSILFPCGTECSATYFYSEKLGLAGPFPLVLADNMENNLVLFVSNNSVVVYRVFGNTKGKPDRIAKIDLGLSGGGDLMQSIIGARAAGAGFSIRYTNARGEERTFLWQPTK